MSQADNPDILDVTSVRLPRGDTDALRAIAHKNNRSFTGELRSVVRRYVAAEQRRARAEGEPLTPVPARHRRHSRKSLGSAKTVDRTER